MKLSEYITRLQNQLDIYGDGPIYFIWPKASISSTTPQVMKDNPVRHYTFNGLITTAVDLDTLSRQRKENKK